MSKNEELAYLRGAWNLKRFRNIEPEGFKRTEKYSGQHYIHVVVALMAERHIVKEKLGCMSASKSIVSKQSKSLLFQYTFIPFRIWHLALSPLLHNTPHFIYWVHNACFLSHLTHELLTSLLFLHFLLSLTQISPSTKPSKTVLSSVNITPPICLLPTTAAPSILPNRNWQTKN